ncbi:sigma-54-dependent Fis family transcriptional regulator [candidate division KSB1 bacterium]|nr:sigma-54-dependent Fis family transcriptional regulator [candidate division KSB1 bacterium]
MSAHDAFILLISSNADWLKICCEYLKEQNVQALPAQRKEEIDFFCRSNQRPNAVVVDLRVDAATYLEAIDSFTFTNDQPVIGLLPQSDLALAIELIKRGGADYILAPFDADEVHMTLKQVWRMNFHPRLLQARKNRWERERVVAVLPAISPIMRERYQRLALLARTDSPILLCGAPGSMKEEYARVVHFLSRRRFQSFIEFDSQTVKAQKLTFLNSVLSRNRDLLPRDAPISGTLFFHRIDHLSPDVQHHLIDYCDERQRLSQNGINSGFRLIFSSSQSAACLPLAKEFIARLGSSTLEWPTLAERREDIPVLADFFLSHFSRRFYKSIDGIDPVVTRQLLQYRWPGDVVELRAAIERAVMLCSGGRLTPQCLVVDPFGSDGNDGTKELRLQNFKLDKVEAHLIGHVLQDQGGNVSRSAVTLGISRGTLYNKLKKYRLEHLVKRNVD